MKLVGVMGGSAGSDPFSPKAWSGSASRLMRCLQAHNRLHRAFGVSLPRLWHYTLVACNFHPIRQVWRRHFYMDPAYRKALTRAVGQCIQLSDYQHGFLQIGGQMDVPSLVDGRAPCFSYHDGNVAVSMRSQVASGIAPRRIDDALGWERRVAQGTTCIFTMSENLRASFINDFGVPEKRVVNVGAGINLDSVPPPMEGKRYDTEEILFIGSDFQRKGGFQLLRAFERVRAKYPRAQLHIVGPHELNIPSNLSRGVVMHGYLDKRDPADRAELEELFQRASLFVLPSLYEPFGIAPLEAMVHEIPCIVTNDWALRESVVPGVTGDHVKLGDVDDLSEKLLAHVGASDVLAGWGRAGRERVLNHYTWEHVVQRIDDAVTAATASS